jgi:phage terminase large subunit-like protein
MTAPAFELAHLAPDLVNDLPEGEALIYAFDALGLWLRPEQRVPGGEWRSCGWVCGRGWGKTYGIAHWINDAVERGEIGTHDGIALVAPNEDRVRDVQVRALVAASPPWFRAEPYHGGVRWPNGAEAQGFTPYEPGRTRGSNFDFAWLTELVDWQSTTRAEAFTAVTTATRAGPNPRFVWDTTSKGKNGLILARLAEHEADPVRHRLIRGTMFDNPFLPAKYLRDECRKYGVGTRRYDEEVLGQVFTESAGALWQQEWIDDNRREFPPRDPALRLVGCDPAISTRSDADETGIVSACRDRVGEVHVLSDSTGRHSPERTVAILVDECLTRGAAGIVIERNRGGDWLVAAIRVEAEARGARVELLIGDRPFPSRTPGRIYIREVHTASSKETRAAGPAALYRLGKVHHVGTLDALETEMTTWEPGEGASPNRLDALSYVVAELAGINTAAPRPLEPGEAQAVQDRLAAMMRQGGRGRGRLGL